VGADTTLETLTALMLARGLSSAAVTNEIGAVVGVVSAADLLALSQSAHLHDATAHQVMHEPSTMLSEQASLATAAALMAVEHSHELPIACSVCESICVLSSHDILSWLGEQSGSREDRKLQHPLIGG
jgi:CBS domain-containing protein